MRNYEAIIILDPSIAENARKDLSDKIQSVITQAGGSEVTLEDWGRREMSFAINKERFGHYQRYLFKSDQSECNANITAALRITEGVFRFQIHLMDVKKRKAA
jgi:small subunit ribosomal protein S6